MDLKLIPHYQPIIETASGRIRGYEALARMRDMTGKVVSAGGLFTDPTLAATERRELDRQIRRQALAILPELPDDSFISINISPEWLNHLDSLDHLPTLEMILQSGGRPEQVVIEITELAADLDRLQRLVERYRSAGMRIAIDDFGSGFSQLDRVAALQPDIIKLDMQLLKNGASGGDSTTIVQMIGELGNRLGASLLCEGVETEQELFFALSCNASYLQGYLFERALPNPIPADSKRAMMARLLDHHLDLALESTSRLHWRRERIQAELIALRELLLSRDKQVSLTDYIATPNLLRFYICDRRGRQISPNYENHNGHWLIDNRHLGYNWSWRPYFFQLLGQPEQSRRLVTSSPYLDIHSRQRCLTSALALDDDRILLADLHDVDELLDPAAPYRLNYGQLLSEIA
ncbi:EAL domain-containing protein [Marinobacterium arenosum]|uniref:EAL domain-containing protein n=1 Tax=Marinobacterium arenosum TaxID=2862496 RepID=UPI001C94F347|nr:EAL domain-containing protein [Marinobacterium arenosum]MBY4677615.1 EAL domain-containing protein [Marinobacterium arenosum]